MKAARHRKIVEIIQNQNIETQEELASRLRDFDIDATQATISRDIKELRIQKTPTEAGSYKYSIPGYSAEQDLDVRLRTIFREGVTSVDYAKNIVVIKTIPGLASAACLAIDAMSYDYIVGSLAGDDTGIIILRDDEHAHSFCLRLSNL
ncbi:MAG: arginine repressor [Oscillospiraceae bacterium]|jgi:transcriptional regulator of arginine metabolism|nr:arginine repressor [Oscillospiraceae bacterium]